MKYMRFRFGRSHNPCFPWQLGYHEWQRKMRAIKIMCIASMAIIMLIWAGIAIHAIRLHNSNQRNQHNQHKTTMHVCVITHGDVVMFICKTK